MRRLLFCTATLCAMGAAPFVGAQNLLTNGAFDTFSHVNGSAGPPVVMDVSTASGWTLNASSPDGVDLAAQFQTGFANANNTGAGGTQSPGTGAGLWFRPFEGNQGGSGQPLADAVLTQSVVAPTTGDYRLDFVAGIEGIANFTASDFSVALSSSGSGGSASVDLVSAAASVPIVDGNIGGAASNNKGGTPFTLELFGVTAGDTLTVTGQMIGGEDSGVNPQSGFLDGFVLTVVPEPSSIVLGLLAVTGIVAVRRRVG